MFNLDLVLGYLSGIILPSRRLAGLLADSGTRLASRARPSGGFVHFSWVLAVLRFLVLHWPLSKAAPKGFFAILVIHHQLPTGSAFDLWAVFQLIKMLYRQNYGHRRAPPQQPRQIHFASSSAISVSSLARSFARSQMHFQHDLVILLPESFSANFMN